MPCFHPREIVVNKPRVVYKWNERSDGSIYRERDESGKLVVLGIDKKYSIQVPCGHCRYCLAQAQSQWSFRIEQEVLHGGYAQSLFVTLTYNNESLPDDFSVHKSEVQKYLHDLRQKIHRKYFDGTKESLPRISYYFCAEYGSKFGRPHYHGIIMFTKSIDWHLIQSAWHKGIVDIREFTSARAGYVAKYSVKDLSLDYAGRERPFHLQSKGLGSAFLNKFNSFASLQFNTYFSNVSGHKVKLPRYYLDKLGTNRSYTKVGESRKSHSFHTSSYNYTNEIARFRFFKYNELELAKSGLSLADFLVSKNNQSQKLELELNNLYKKTSSYYVLSRLESQSLQKSV